MAMSDHLTQITKMRGKVVHVDPAQLTIDFACKDGAGRRVAMMSFPFGFRWPNIGEEWMIYEENGYWILGGRFLNPEELVTMRGLAPGEGMAI